MLHKQTNYLWVLYFDDGDEGTHRAKHLHSGSSHQHSSRSSDVCQSIITNFHNDEIGHGYGVGQIEHDKHQHHQLALRKFEFDQK